ncbi:Phosphoglycolate phosphatase [Rubripirellula lacrimiformis]|uniref:phosphoglycolate phosphatase n=1 Tax=Rubripirellula lacrimiformis TaxID=1930273 RepID=A0A517NDW3_9BACT|nr:HAD family hydrolase [Rubripirellula lacrimiformis]QDT05316.1 Phosphoglycolate phosphatase [Rubripirellula lacrimiformis]
MRTLLFDIDGTLLVTRSGGATALRHAMTDEFGLSDPHIDIQFGGRTDRSILTELLTSNGLPDTQANRDRLRDRYIQRFPEVLNQVGGQMMPGVMPLLEELKGHAEVRSYVMTGNFQVTGQHKLDHFRLGGFFRGIFGGDQDSDRDELARRTADALVQRYGPDATADVIVVGDTVADIRCGHCIGAKVVAVCTGGQDRSLLEQESPLAVADDLTDLPAILKLLTS